MTKDQQIKDTEGSEGTIMQGCPFCGQFCKVPKVYWYRPYWYGAYANSYCKRCKKKVKLEVEFL